ncbi:MAG: phosphonoacetaldehyde reductase [Kiloniellales bacterium]
MVLTHPFRCPTQVVEGPDCDKALAELIGGRSWALVTSQFWTDGDVPDRLAGACGEPAVRIGGVEANPSCSAVIALAEDFPPGEVVVALGGGSVMDAAKGIVALTGINGDVATLMAHLREGRPLPDDLEPVPIIAVPTTSGSGSEVTQWGTIWGDDGIKFSVSDPRLRPGHAVHDPALCASMPAELTLASGLDALSHAIESVWNRHHSPVTDALATTAIGVVRNNLKAALDQPGDVELRRRMQTAALISGLTMGTTQTALAHSISYQFTSRFGVPHGLACSFSLAECARYNAADDPERLKPIAAGLGCALDAVPQSLEDWFDELGLGAALSRYVTPAHADRLDDALITRARAANNIREVDGPAARQIAARALRRLCPVATDDRRPARGVAAR